jgi:hypothetical protein
MKRFFVRKIFGYTHHDMPIFAPENNHKYLVVNIDESYAEAVFELIKKHEKEKGTWDAPDNFLDFIKEI